MYKAVSGCSKLLACCLFVLVFSDTPAQSLFLRNYHTADSFFVAGKYDTSGRIFDQILRDAISDSFIAEILHRKGIIFLRTGAEDSAIFYEERALDIFTEKMNFTKMSRAEGNISYLYASKRIYDKALVYNLSALSSARLAADSLLQYFNLCHLYEAQKKYGDFFKVMIDHIRYFKDGLMHDQAFLINSNFGLYYANVKRRDSALYFFNQALLSSSSGYDSSAAYNNISDEFRLVKNYKRAILYLDSAFSINRKSGNLSSELVNCETYIQIDSSIGDFRNALRYSQLARQLSDDIFENGKANALLEADVKYQTEKKEAANKLLTADNRLKERNFIFSLIAVGMLALLTSLSFRSYRQKQKVNITLTAQKNELRHLADQLELGNQTKALLLSTIGHDLRSPLSSLYAILKMRELNAGNDTAGGIMSNQVTGLLGILENLLAWSKLKLLETELMPMPVRVNMQELYAEQADFYMLNAVRKKILLVNEAPDNMLLVCDEYMLGTVIRNAIGNAMNHVQAGEQVVLSVEKRGIRGFVCRVKNLCSRQNFERFEFAFEHANIQSGSHGLGLVLIKEFGRLLRANICLSYSGGWAMMEIAINDA